MVTKTLICLILYKHSMLIFEFYKLPPPANHIEGCRRKSPEQKTPDNVDQNSESLHRIRIHSPCKIPADGFFDYALLPPAKAEGNGSLCYFCGNGNGNQNSQFLISPQNLYCENGMFAIVAGTHPSLSAERGLAGPLPKGEFFDPKLMSS